MRTTVSGTFRPAGIFVHPSAMGVCGSALRGVPSRGLATKASSGQALPPRKEFRYFKKMDLFHLNDGLKKKKKKFDLLFFAERAAFDWTDPLNFESQLSEEERAIRNEVADYCQDKLMSRVTAANRHEKFDREIFNEMGELGMLGATIDGYGCSGVNYVTYGLIAREVERYLSLLSCVVGSASSGMPPGPGWTAATAQH